METNIKHFAYPRQPPVSFLRIDAGRLTGYPSPVSTVKEIRRSRLGQLLETHTAAEIARRLGVAPGYISQMKAGLPTGRNIGDKTARKLEAEFGLPLGWMDQPDSIDSPAALSSVPEGTYSKSQRLVAVFNQLSPDLQDHALVLLEKVLASHLKAKSMLAGDILERKPAPP